MKRASLARGLAQSLSNLHFSDLPDEVVERCKVSTLNVLAACYAGRDLPWSRIAAEVAQRGHGTSTVWSYKDRVSSADAAMANAVMSHAVLLEDFAVGLGHPGIFVVPAAIAVGEECGSSGPELISAIASAYEALFHIGRNVLGKLNQGFGESSILGVFGAAVAASKALKLNENELTGAIGLAASSASGTLEHWTYGTMEGMFQVGIGCRNGVLAAYLAKSGALAAETSLDGPHGFYMAFTGMSRDLAEETDSGDRSEFAIMKALMKRYPSCGANQATLHLGAALSNRLEISASTVDKVVEKVSPSILTGAGNNCPGPFSNQFQAQMSTQFCLAAALLGKPVDTPAYFVNHYQDPEVLALARKVELVPEKGRDWLNPRIEVLLLDGAAHSLEADCRSELVPDRKDAEKSFMAYAGNALGHERAAEVVTTVLNLDRLPNVAALARLLKP